MLGKRIELNEVRVADGLKSWVTFKRLMPSCQMHFESRGLKRSLHKGPSINDVTPEGDGGEYKKFQFCVIFKAYLGWQGEGEGSKNW